MKLIGVIEGDGIGREVVPAALQVLERAGLDLAVRRFDVGAERFLRTGTAIPDEEMAELAGADAILLGAIGDPRVTDPGYTTGTLARLRGGLDLYANVRPARLLDDRLSPLRDPRRRRADLVVVRENTEGLYTTLGGRFRAGTDEEVALQEHVNTHRGVSRVIEHAFRIARREVVLASKWNAMPHAGALWLRCWQDARARHPQTPGRHLAVDACALHLVRDPSAFDVVVAENCFGDILSDVAAAVVGGLGVVPSASLNPETGKALFEPVHGSAPDIAGRGAANPVAAVLSGALMARHLGFAAEAAAIERAVGAAVRARECTADIGGGLSTAEAAAAIARRL
ncbi:MAG TPA: isocitrate/isopropylmalate family dehydrogenase [Streptosporangiaceae bacterium]|jgi:3-isopropylmalate dehydrogenase|nr:isocitrate/isopropylmalate family dehydrogenase [Streptosporangiaceae bacterium]